MKKCSKCNELKDESKFVKRSNRKSGIQSYCKSCHNIKSRREYRPEYMRNYDLMSKYGITLEEADKIMLNQNSCCAICNIHISEVSKGHKKQFCVDHNHDTGKVRGLLCDSCNRGIGLLKDSVEVLNSAIEYLNKNN